MALRQREWCLIIIILVGLIIKTFIEQSTPHLALSELRHLLHAATDAESLLAFGTKLSLSEADEYDLAQISGISNNIASAIFNNKNLILEKARRLPPDQKHLALTVVHGIAEKKATQFGSHLSFTTSNQHSGHEKGKYTTFRP